MSLELSESQRQCVERGWSGAGGGGQGVNVTGTEPHLGRQVSSGEGWWGRLHSKVNVLNAVTGHLKMTTMVNFMLYRFYHNKKKVKNEKHRPMCTRCWVPQPHL